MTRVGLVLGAGGIVGQAYQAGVLAALEHDLGWDPRDADIIVGSSAGSVTGTLLRLGVPASDLAAWAVEAPLSIEGAPIMDQLGQQPEFPPIGRSDLLRAWRLPTAALLAGLARRPWAFRPVVAAMTMLPAGRLDLRERAATLDALFGDNWPTGLWICAARRDTGRRVVFGSDGAPPAAVASAVAASCAIPGYFAPIEISGVEYFDGGVHSPTNADVLAREGLDLVIVVSSMSVAHGRAFTADSPLRWSAHRRLEHEVRRLRRGGTAVVRFEPGRRTLSAMGVNAMADDRSTRVVGQAFLDGGRYAGTPAIAARLAAITTRPGRQAAHAEESATA
jgi:NTE family protein